MALAIPQRRVWVALAALILASLGIRRVGLDHGLPHHMEPDAQIGMQVEYLRGTHGDRRAISLATYPTLVAHAATIAFDPPPVPGDNGARTLEEHLAIASKHVLDVRRVVAWISVLVVPGTYLLARRFVPPGWALAAAACAGLSPLAVSFAQQARPHAAAAAFYPWAVAAAIALRRRGDVLSYAAAGLAAALAIGCLHNAIALVIPLAAAHTLREKRRILDPRALIPLALVALSIALFYRHVLASVFGSGPHVQTDGPELASGAHVIDPAELNGRGVPAIAGALWSYEPCLFALATLALVACARSRAGGAPFTRAISRDAWVAASFAVPYLLVLGVWGGTCERFLLPAIPFFAVFGAWGARELSGSRVLRPIARALLALALALPAACSACLVRLRARPDTLELAASWVREHAAPDVDRVLLSPLPYFKHRDSSLDLPLARSAAAVAGPGGPRVRYYGLWSIHLARVAADSLPPPRYAIEWVVWSSDRETPSREQALPLEGLLADPRALLRYSGAGIYVIEDYRDRPAYFVAHRSLQRALEAAGTRLARFAPDDSSRGLEYQDETDGRPHAASFAWRCLTARAVGPAVEIWRVSPEDLGR